jgi:alanyl-tRNA synthetase
LYKVCDTVINENASAYPELVEKKEYITKLIKIEEENFSKTIDQGMALLQSITDHDDISVLSGEDAFKLNDTFGFPIELTQELAAEKGFTVDVKGFNEAFAKHQELSRTAEAGQFKSGLGDHSEETTALHTATHLLHAALRKVLGDHVGQKGSNITPERLRFDFSHGEKMTKEQIQQVEDLVNDAIKRDLQVSVETMTPQEAVEKGAVAFFSSKYGEQVTVYTIGDFSKEVCAGPHVKHTGDMGHFHILKEESSSSGVRRIKAVLEK